MEKALIYLRVSTDGQLKKENPIETQRERCLEYVQRNGYIVDETTDIYVDGQSGRTGDRYGFEKLMERVAQDKSVRYVIAYDLSRIFRNAVEFFLFERDLQKHGVQFLSASESFSLDHTPSSWLSKYITAGFAQFRSMQDGVKIKSAMRYKAESGMYPGKAPFGYKNVREPGGVYGKEKRWMEKDERQSVWVEKAFQMYATEQYSFESLAATLHAQGFPTPNGRPLAPSMLEKILKKKTYIGVIDWGGVYNPNGQHEKLVDPALFNKVQDIIQARLHGSNRSRKHTFLLRGVAVCGSCGSRVTAGIHRGKMGAQYTYYSCSKNKSATCKEPSVLLRDLETDAEAKIRQVQLAHGEEAKLRERIRSLVQQETQVHAKMRSSLATQIENVQSRKKSLLEKYVDNKIEDDAYMTFKARLEAEEAKCRDELARVEQRLAAGVRLMERALILANDCHRAFLQASPAYRQLLVRALFAKIMVKDKRIVSAPLNHPFVTVCKKQVLRHPEFQLGTTGGDGGSRTLV